MNTIQKSEKERGPAGGVFARFFRWRFCWRVMRRCLFVVACLATLTGLFYAVEDWRGKRAWEKCRRELEAKGEVLDWNAYIPAPVPDDQNIFKAPKMAEWFVKASFAEAFPGKDSKPDNAAAPFRLAPGQDAKNGPVLVAEVDVVPPGAPLPAGKADTVLRFDDTAAREQAAKLLRENLGPCARGVWGGVILARLPDQIKPVQLVLQADTVPTAQALAEFFPGSAVPYTTWNSSDPHDFQVVPAGTNTFQVSLKLSENTPADYLARSQSAVPDLDVLRQALERPRVRMDGDYEQPFVGPVAHFVRFRTVAQLLAQRAQCHLLLGQPEAAWHELKLARDLCRMLAQPPESKGTLLVPAMIDAAISGLYVAIIQDGLRLRVWREPQLAAMQQQLQDINLLLELRGAMNVERAACCHTIETTPRAELETLFSGGDKTKGLWDKLQNPRALFVALCPRGWLYQNMCALASAGT